METRDKLLVINVCGIRVLLSKLVYSHFIFFKKAPKLNYTVPNAISFKKKKKETEPLEYF